MASTRRRDGVRRAVALCAATILMLATACGDDDEPDEDGSSSTTTQGAITAAPPSAAMTPEAEVEAVYLELVDTVYRLVTTTPDPDDPNLSRVAVDPVLGDVRDSLSTMKAENHIVQLGSRTSHRVMSITFADPDKAVLRDCSVGNDTTIDQDDGSIVSEGLSTRVLEATLISIDGAWAVSKIGTIAKFDGEVPCPE